MSKARSIVFNMLFDGSLGLGVYCRVFKLKKARISTANQKTNNFLPDTAGSPAKVKRLTPFPKRADTKIKIGFRASL